MFRVVVVLAVLCASCGVPGTVPTTTAAPASTSAVVTTSTSTVTTVASPPTSIEAEGPSSELMAEMQALVSITEELRGLYFLEEPLITVLTSAELADRVRQVNADELDPDTLERDQEALRILGVLDGELDLGSFFTDLLAEQVVGFYDSDAREMVVQASETGLTEYEKLIIVHELTHALTDQHFDFGRRSSSLGDSEEYDARAALSSLVEGDATYVEGLYVRGLDQGALLKILAEFDEIQSPLFEQAPYYLQQTLVASYTEGLDFVTSQFAVGGWSAVDLAYRTAPGTTEQVLHPASYAAGEAAKALTLDSTPPDGYEVGEESTWGESGLKALLGAVLLPTALDEAVSGWGGDRYRVLWDGTRAIFELHYVGDTSGDSDELADGFDRYLEASVPVDARWWVLRSGDEVVVVVATDRTAGTALVKGLQAEGYS